MMNTPELQWQLERPWTRVLSHDVDGVIGYIAELPDCLARSGTMEECLWELDGALYRWLREALRQGIQIPSPREPHEFATVTQSAVATVKSSVEVKLSIQELATLRAVLGQVFENDKSLLTLMKGIDMKLEKAEQELIEERGAK